MSQSSQRDQGKARQGSHQPSRLFYPARPSQPLITQATSPRRARSSVKSRGVLTCLHVFLFLCVCLCVCVYLCCVAVR
ncbi:hypothetical protein E2C01_096285 [Portunus trituberculatus]|uniref:Uncharacterized protein n=1 Tax=Portunus trituberculatus TaxID=210409 RepID=A0A5B7K1M4_PORTR|nr:hypothetical protein [Portunus trituberculatus]